MTVKVWDPKDPDEIDDFDIDWTPYLLGFGETVPSDTIDPAKPTLWNIDGPDQTLIVAPQGKQDSATLTKIWLAGGTLNEKYTVTNRIVTVAGRQLEVSGTLTIKTKGWNGPIT